MTPTTARLPALDVLRAVAVLLVIGRHLSFVPVPPGHSETFRGFVEMWVRGGWIGVDLFFVLSGFLVSGLLFAEYRTRGTLFVGRFYVRRWFKIYPPFAVLLLATLGLQAAQGQVRWVDLGIEAVFLQNYSLTGLWDHTWSLAVEEHFYLLLPVVLLLLVRARRGDPDPFRPLVWLVPLVGCVCLYLRLRNAAERPEYVFITHMCPTHLRIDSLFVGVLLGYLYHFRRAGFEAYFRQRRGRLLFAAAVLAGLPFLLPVEVNPVLYTYGLTALTLAAAAMVGVLVTAELPAWRGLRAAAFLGAHSYSIYLWHVPMMVVGVPYLMAYVTGPLRYWQLMAVYLGGSVLVGVAMAKLVEGPSLRLRNRLFPPPARPT